MRWDSLSVGSCYFVFLFQEKFFLNSHLQHLFCSNTSGFFGNFHSPLRLFWSIFNILFSLEYFKSLCFFLSFKVFSYLFSISLRVLICCFYAFLPSLGLASISELVFFFCF